MPDDGPDGTVYPVFQLTFQDEGHTCQIFLLMCDTLYHVLSRVVKYSPTPTTHYIGAYSLKVIENSVVFVCDAIQVSSVVVEFERVSFC